MKPQVYDSLLNALNDGAKDGTARLLASSETSKPLIDSLNSDLSSKVRLCVKNYGQPKGVSTALHSEGNYEVMGPMGKGLMVNRKGVHVAFAAGTGVLVFVDLVMHLALVNL